MLFRQLRAEPLPHLCDVIAENDGVGTREVDMLEDATRLALARELMHDAHAALFEHEHFAGAHFADRLRPDEVKRACLARNGDRVIEPAEHERTESVRIARGKD